MPKAPRHAAMLALCVGHHPSIIGGDAWEHFSSEAHLRLIRVVQLAGWILVDNLAVSGRKAVDGTGEVCQRGDGGAWMLIGKAGGRLANDDAIELKRDARVFGAHISHHP